MLEILYAILPVFLIIGAGIVVEKIKLIPVNASVGLNEYAIRLALPVLLIYIMADARPAELFQWKLWLGVVAAHVIIYMGCYYADLLFVKRGKMPAVVSALAGSGSMGAFVGIPIVMNLLPGNQEALLVAGVIAIVPSIFVAVGQIHLEIKKQQDGKQSNFLKVLTRSFFLNPLIIGMLVGLVLCLLEIGLWPPVERAAVLVGSTAAPCALIGLGLNVRSQLNLAAKAEHKVRYQTFIVVSKLVVLPFLTWGILLALGVGGAPLLVSVVMLATGVGIGPYVVAAIYKAIPEQCALAVVLTNILSMVSVTFFAYVLIKILQVI